MLGTLASLGQKTPSTHPAVEQLMQPTPAQQQDWAPDAAAQSFTPGNLAADGTRGALLDARPCPVGTSSSLPGARR